MEFISDAPTHWNYWKREALAYQSGILDSASSEVGDGLAAPRCRGVVERSPTEVWLWLEDIDGVLASECPLQRYRRAACHLGRLQDSYLTGHPVPDQAWLTRNWLRPRMLPDPGVMNMLRDPRPWQHPLNWRAFPIWVADAILRLWAERETLLMVLVMHRIDRAQFTSPAAAVVLRRGPGSGDASGPPRQGYGS